MKKLFLFGAVAAAMGLASCNGGSVDSPKTFEDSIAVLTATAQGQGLVRHINNLPEEMREKISKESFIRGLQMVMDADTAGMQDFFSGLQYGMQQMQGMMQMEESGLKVDRQLFVKAFTKAFMADSVSDAEMMKINDLLTPVQEKMTSIVMKKQEEKMAAMTKANNEKFEANKKAGSEFLAKTLAADKTIKVTESGLAYKVTKMGNGPVAKETDRVNVKYTGKLIDGTEFDSSKGAEVPFSPKGVVPGFGEALTTLPAGTEVTLYIPENLGYGRQGQGKIQPGSTLIFEIVIGDVVTPPTPKPQPQEAKPVADSVKAVKK